MKTSITRPTTTSGWLDNYIKLVVHEDLIAGLKDQTEKSLQYLSALSADQLDFRYAEGKWSIKEIILHLVDTERIFGYRALCFARRDKSELPGFDENLYVANSYASQRSLQSLLEEYIVTRTSTVALFSNLEETVIHSTGIANGMVMTPAALGFATLGHEIHHLRIIEERYIQPLSTTHNNLV